MASSPWRLFSSDGAPGMYSLAYAVASYKPGVHNRVKLLGFLEEFQPTVKLPFLERAPTPCSEVAPRAQFVAALNTAARITTAPEHTPGWLAGTASGFPFTLIASVMKSNHP